MIEIQLIEAIRLRAANKSTRTDNGDETIGYSEVALPASEEAIERAEETMHSRLHPLHRHVLMGVGNGGFGPGDGLIGVTGGYRDAHGQSLEELRDALWLDEKTPMPTPVVPLCDWGSGIWSCVDGETGAVLTMDENGLVVMGETLHSWLAIWVSGASLFEKMLTFQTQKVIDPFTKRETTIRLPGRPRGRCYVPGPSSPYR